MTTIHLSGRITEAGQLEVTLPEGLPPGDVEITIQVAAEDQQGDERPWTKEEIREMLTFTPKSGAEILASGVVGSWRDLGIEDSAAWVEDIRRKIQERRA